MLTDGRSEPEESVALAESLTVAFMVLLDTLSPEERAVFLLREALSTHTPRSPRCSPAPRPTAVSSFTARRNGFDRAVALGALGRAEAGTGPALRECDACRRRR